MDNRKLLMVALASLSYHDAIPVSDPRAFYGSGKAKRHSSRLCVKPNHKPV